MKFSYGRNDLNQKEKAQSFCYLLANGLGGYSSLSITQSLTRNDHALLMAAIKAPNLRYHMLSKVEECIKIDGVDYELSSQEFVDYTKNKSGEQYLVNFTQDYLPVWTYLVGGVEVRKIVVMDYGKNSVGIKYEIETFGNKDVSLCLTPCVQFVEKGTCLRDTQTFEMCDTCITSNGQNLYIHAPNSTHEVFDTHFDQDVYYGYDARDGREAVGCYAKGISFMYDVSTCKEAQIMFTMEAYQGCVDEWIQCEIKRQKELIKQAGAKEECTKSFVRAADQFVVKRESTQGYTLMAGYPFFADWGRDTMYAIEGCCIATKRFDETKGILRTFVKYLKDGLMPNLFPEGDKPPRYNTVDASLLFLQAMKLYYDASHDIAFVKEQYDAMESIITWYQKGTAFDIKMDKDGLIQAGSGYNQLTWMDINYKNILPTPRHGKPVEVNAFWYSGIRTLCEFGKLLNKDIHKFEKLAIQVEHSFQEKFWNEERHCLFDVISGKDYDKQVRCNQIWAVSVPYSPITKKQAKQVVETVFHELYTPYGLRTLAVKDPQFVATYGGCLKKRDLSYHQGTVWPFPLGSYFKAYLKVHEYSEEAKQIVRRQLSLFEDCLREGCIGQVAEIYDGLDPATSRGSFAQGWSIGELLKVMLEVEQ